ncbi:MAG TPA: hypothetical protein VK447_00635 [Myxococcaceae bacterium]|nr:hypothetical protein [Myxococcaceae bacterium]
METPDEPAPTVTIGGREVSHLVAALIAQESDRLGILPGQVGDVMIPDPAPTHVMISGYSLSIETSAAIATFADANGLHPVRVIQDIVREHAEALDRKARTRETTCPLEGTWAVRSDCPKGRGGGSRDA